MINRYVDAQGAQPGSSLRYIPELDGLRGIAILMVLVWHYAVGQALTEGGAFRFAEGGLMEHLAQVGRLTWSGVDLFFVLSGFLIGGILLDARSAPSYFKPFYTRRFFRIVPIYAALLALFWLLGAVPFLSSYSQDAYPWYAYATFTQNFWMAASGTFGANWLGPTWSLAVEEQFYLTLPLLIRYVRQPYLTYVLLGGVVAAPVIRTLLYVLYDEGAFASVVLMPCRADALMLGVLGAMAVRKPEMRLLFTNNRRHFSWLLLIGLAGVVLLTFQDWTIFTFVMSSLGHSWLAAFYLCLLLYVVVYPDSVLGTVMRNRLLSKLGLIAYGTYLLHVLVLSVCHGVARNLGILPGNLANAGVTLFALALTLAAAGVSWVYFERPLVRLGRRYHYGGKA